MFKPILLLSSWMMLQLVHYAQLLMSPIEGPSSKYKEACLSNFRGVTLLTSRCVVVLQTC